MRNGSINHAQKLAQASAPRVQETRGNSEYDALRCAQLFAAGPVFARVALTEASQDDQVAEKIVARLLEDPIYLTGAEAVAVLLARAGVRHVFAYAGTSELALCDAVDRTELISLNNGRGDKESAFLAAGGSLLQPNRAAAILHGARGLTNAAGGLADARRNEAGTVYVVGLPSTGSMRFLPPHGEPHLIEAMGNFARWAWEASAVPAEKEKAAEEYIAKFLEAIATAARQPYGPVLFGVPQDVAEARWLSLAVFARACADFGGEAELPAVGRALELLQAARRPLFLVDDYALHYDGIHEELDRVTRLLGAPVLQLRYRRGPMLFERLRSERVGHFVGWLNQFSAAHRALLDDADLLITVEDRNIYRRVVGDL
ncbi:thiamine pyrophosphate-binding protein, partial [Nocardia aurea]|uniref:thiamine pyrophosphate-binding protein n=1 Tax=Nocardia aurea TaxID=2144174 RepID=UPI0018E55B6A